MTENGLSPSPAGRCRYGDKLFLRVKEAVRFSGLPESTIRRLLRTGKLPGVKAGGWRIRWMVQPFFLEERLSLSLL